MVAWAVVSILLEWSDLIGLEPVPFLSNYVPIVWIQWSHRLSGSSFVQKKGKRGEKKEGKRRRGKGRKNKGKSKAEKSLCWMMRWDFHCQGELTLWHTLPDPHTPSLTLTHPHTPSQSHSDTAVSTRPRQRQPVHGHLVHEGVGILKEQRKWSQITIASSLLVVLN